MISFQKPCMFSFICFYCLFLFSWRVRLYYFLGFDFPMSNKPTTPTAISLWWIAHPQCIMGYNGLITICYAYNIMFNHCPCGESCSHDGTLCLRCIYGWMTIWCAYNTICCCIISIWIWIWMHICISKYLYSYNYHNTSYIWYYNYNEYRICYTIFYGVVAH